MTIHPDFLIMEELIYKPISLIIQHQKVEDESAEYGAAEFNIDNRLIKFRVGKITPKKIGQFVTFWKRIGKGPILPYSYNDPFELLIVNIRADNHHGLFCFPKKILCEKGIITSDKKKGKRAMRVYPPWDKPDSPQAIKTQAWQLNWFIEIPENRNIDFAHAKYLLCSK
ncbi:MAG: MepB family protein [Parachlamydiaceae bacterium]|nr:MepB family protein [Parachlamydiaceae bacterium]